jgi:hypothetical protein
MNPYLEQDDVWEDFHLNFMTRAQEVLAGEVGPNYVVKVETRLYVHELSAKERRLGGRADVGIAIVPGASQTATPAAAVASAPLEVIFPSVDIERYASLEIHDRRNRRVVTAIELLSPTNKKPGPDRDDYVGKRRLVMATPCSFVEIDLRRGGQRPGPPEPPPCDYYVLVSRNQDRPRHGIWPIGLRDPLPVVPIPLKPPDADVPLDLKAVLDRVYDAADYGKYIYGETPEPPLSEEDAAWARQFVPAGK